MAEYIFSCTKVHIFYPSVMMPRWKIFKVVALAERGKNDSSARGKLRDLVSVNLPSQGEICQDSKYECCVLCLQKGRL